MCAITRVRLTGRNRLPSQQPVILMRFEYIPVLAMLVLAALVPAIFLGVSWLFGPRRPSAVKSEPFECGNPPTGPAWGRFSVKFYLTALLFMLFDLEVVILIPWTFIYREFLANHIAILGPILFFIGVLILGLVYEVKKGALQWEK